MLYSSPQISLQLDLTLEDPRVILRLSSKEGKNLGLVFKCVNRLKAILDAIIDMQDSLSPENVNTKRVQLLDACPDIFRISASGDKLIPVKPQKPAKTD